MKFQNRFIIPFFLFAVSGYLCSAVAQEDSTSEPPTTPDSGERSDGGQPKGKGWDSLDESQKMKLREALRDVWTDPAVISAREEVKVATEAYQRAIRTAIGKTDPSVAGALKTLQEMSEGRSQERLGSGMPGGGSPVRMMPRRSGDYPMGSPSFLESLSEADRTKFREAEKAARESEAVNLAKSKLEQLRKDDEMLRRKRMEALREIRMATLNEMVRIDPSLAELKERLVGAWRSGEGIRQKGGPKGPPKGSGKPRQPE